MDKKKKKPFVKYHISARASGGWCFVTLYGNNKELIDIIDKKEAEDANENKGFFENDTKTAFDGDLRDDEYLMTGAYDCRATFTKHFDNLKQMGIWGNQDALLSDEMKLFFMKVLNHLVRFIQENNDKPEHTKKYILDAIKQLDTTNPNNVGAWGLVLQILILQSLLAWMEKIKINEGDDGYDELEIICDWIAHILVEKLVVFCHVPYGDEDKKRLEPLCRYLCTTEAGQYVQQIIKERYGLIKEPTDKPEQHKVLPDELNNDTAKKYFEEAIKYELMDENYKWLSTKALLAQFAFEMSMKLELNKAESANKQRYASWKPFEQLFGYTNLRGTYNDFKKTGESPKGIEKINKVFDL